VLVAIFKGKSNGFCVEVGANDGISGSTTLFFEKLGWDCLLVEPNPALCELIRASRRSTLMECAASDKAGSTVLLVAEGAPWAHAVSTINSDAKALATLESYGLTWREVRVQTRALDEILESLKIDREIDFISIDVEGHELAVLQGFSVERWRPRILLVEDNSDRKDPSVRNYLKSRGYLPFARSGVNDWYARQGDDLLTGAHRFLGALILCLGIQRWVKNQVRRIPGVVRAKNAIARSMASGE
jgi:FkbM family methyltransferase